MTKLEQKILFIQGNFELGGYTIVARECVTLVEQALRQVLKQSLSELEEKDRLKFQETEWRRGRGGTGFDSFTMGQLINVIIESNFLDAWARVSGRDPGNIRSINLDELRKLRNKFIRNGHKATRSEAEFLFQCLQVILETFGFASLENPGEIFSLYQEEHLRE